MNKKLLILIAMAIVVIPVAAACGRTAPTGVTTLPAPKIPHAVDVLFANCNACHVTDQLKANKPIQHVGTVLGKPLYYANSDCISAACHVVQTGATTPPPTTSTTPPPTSGGTTTGTGTGTPPPSSSTGGGTLPEVGIAITTHNQAAMKAYTGLCLLCHGQNTSNAQPYPPTWDGKAYGSVKYPGVYTVAPGSKADHTGYTNATDCLQANCHVAPTS